MRASCDFSGDPGVSVCVDFRRCANVEEEHPTMKSTHPNPQQNSGDNASHDVNASDELALPMAEDENPMDGHPKKRSWVSSGLSKIPRKARLAVSLISSGCPGLSEQI